jgi:hypothetical protein
MQTAQAAQSLRHFRLPIAEFGSVIWRIGNRQLEIDDVLT